MVAGSIDVDHDVLEVSGLAEDRLRSGLAVGGGGVLHLGGIERFIGCGFGRLFGVPPQPDLHRDEHEHDQHGHEHGEFGRDGSPLATVARSCRCPSHDQAGAGTVSGMLLALVRALAMKIAPRDTAMATIAAMTTAISVETAPRSSRMSTPDSVQVVFDRHV